MCSRAAPPHVAPLEYRGVWYQQDWQAHEFGGAPYTTYLLAFDRPSLQRHWMLPLYSVAPPPPFISLSAAEYFAALELGPAPDTLLITTETGRRLLVDLQQRSVQPLPALPRAQMPQAIRRIDFADIAHFPSPPRGAYACNTGTMLDHQGVRYEQAAQAIGDLDCVLLASDSLTAAPLWQLRLHADPGPGLFGDSFHHMQLQGDDCLLIHTRADRRFVVDLRQHSVSECRPAAAEGSFDPLLPPLPPRPLPR